MTINFNDVETPSYIIDENQLLKNLEQFQYVKQQTGCDILLATKAYSCYHTYPLIRQYLDGTANSSLNETKLSFEEFGKKTHVYSPGYKKQDFDKLTSYASAIVFNSINQFQQYKDQVLLKNRSIYLRLNPEHIEVENPLYSPCAPGSRFGILLDDLKSINLEHVDGFHIHALCQNNEDSLGRLIEKSEEKFKDFFMLPQIKWVNFGGGHMVSRSGYQISVLCDHINAFQKKYNVTVILEPGESVVYNTGYLVTEILDIVQNKMAIAIVDTSATAHMPDVIEMPYQPTIQNGENNTSGKYVYRIGGISCLSGDIIGEYSFDQPLQVGQKLVFNDMAQYTMVKNTTFNGIELPKIYIYGQDKQLKCVNEFNYDSFKSRL